MRCLIVPDVHERLDRLQLALEGRIDKADRVVFLGDWFDAFGPIDLDKIKQVCNLLNRIAIGPLMDPSDREIPADFLLGNHDCHYFFRHDGFKCSGYEPSKQMVIDQELALPAKEAFKISTKVGPYLVSHAGYTEASLRHRQEEPYALKQAFNGGFHFLFGAGRARGGNQAVGGPTWLDWNYEFEHIDDIPQIVGHTNGRDVRSKGLTKTVSKVDGDGDMNIEIGLMSWCLDTALHHIAWVDEETGEVTIEQCC